MWAQLIKVQLKPDADLLRASDTLKSYEQADSGLVRELFLQDQSDPTKAYILAIFESEAKAREREQDPRREEGQAAMRSLMGELLAGPPEFINLTVTDEWTP